jgi:tetratricopeptide (TPR) repeat protein
MTEQIDTIISKNPFNVDTHLQVAQFYQKKSDYQTAVSILKKGVEINKDSRELHLALAKIYLIQNRMDDVQRILGVCQHLASDKKSAFAIQIQSLLAQTLVLQGDLSAAEITVDYILGLDPKNANAHYIKGKIFLLNLDIKSAIEEFKIVISQTPGFEPAHQSLVQAYYQTAKQNKALLALEQALEYLPFSKNLHQTLAEAYTSYNKYEQAEVQLRSLIKYWPLDPMSYLTLGDFFFATDQFVKAEQTFLKLANLHNENAIGYLRLSKLYQKQGQLQKAAAIFKKVKLKNRSDANQLFNGQIQFLIDQKKFAEALFICNERLSQNSKDEFILNLRGIIHTKQKKTAAARQDFEKAIGLTPCWPIPHVNLARFYLSKGDIQKAISWFESALQFNAPNIEVYMELARIYERHKNYPKVIEVYERALVLHPNMWTAVKKLAFYLVEHSYTPKDLQRALTLIRRAQFCTPYDPYTEDTLAWIFYKKGHLKKARRTMEAVLTHYPDNPIFNYHMGKILEKSGLMSAAREKFSIALASKEDFITRQVDQALLDQLEIINKMRPKIRLSSPWTFK